MIGMQAADLVPARAVFVGRGIRQRNAGGSGSSSHSQQQALHLRSEFAARGLFGGKANAPISQGAHIADSNYLIEKMELRPIRLAAMAHPHRQADQRIESEACGNLEFAISPSDGEQLTASGQKQKEQNPQDCEGFLRVKDHPA